MARSCYLGVTFSSIPNRICGASHCRKVWNQTILNSRRITRMRILDLHQLPKRRDQRGHRRYRHLCLHPRKPGQIPKKPAINKTIAPLKRPFPGSIIASSRECRDGNY